MQEELSLVKGNVKLKNTWRVKKWFSCQLKPDMIYLIKFSQKRGFECPIIMKK